ncbi:MAG: GNAT family N-acetyltransferase [Ruminococcaceae bacterium]|jgi:RimJ/RimL family protein N-acetyltransferase|nr:GNAT family N-acetyltransferase [Oscillospiraceae bacterium]
MVVLRDMTLSDVDDYVRWFTTDVGWMKMDAPWETEIGDPEDERKSWNEYFKSVQGAPDDAVRWKFEIELDGRHIGWVSRYSYLDYLDNSEEIPAVGIDIPEEDVHNTGVGTEALRLYLDYLGEHGFRSFYTQTWAGNTVMLRVAEKLGFREVCRKEDYRVVDGEAYDAITLRLDR